MTSSSTSRAGSPAGDLAGTILAGRYRLVRPIASGGMAQVWEGADQVLARRVAIKILHPHLARDESFVRRFQGEAIAAARLAHPSIVSVYDTLAEDGINAIVMELVTGTTLRADIDRHGPLTLTAVLAIGSQVADALGTAHASKLVHRDVKPANILLSSDGRVLVADFGIAKAVAGGDLTSDGTMVGTAKYLAPEQVTGGPVDGRTDLYALGVVLYEALTGTPPFVGDNDTSTALMRLNRNPVPLRQRRPDIPPAVEAVVARAMAREPAQRFASAAAMRSALVAAGADPAQAFAAAQAAVERQPGGSSPYPTNPTAAPAARPDLRRHGPNPNPPGARVRPPVGSSTPPPGPAPATSATPTGAATPTGTDEYDRSGGLGRWLILAVVMIGLGLAAVAASTDMFAGSSRGEPVAVRTLASFDPSGGDGEMDHLLAHINDGDPESFWRTEHYEGHRDVAEFKGGVGLRASLDSTGTVDQLNVGTTLGGWSAEIYAHRGTLPEDREGWGAPIGHLQDAATGSNTVALEPTTADHVLIWFTYLTPELTATVTTLEVRGA